MDEQMKFASINGCSKFILTSAFICLQSSFLFQHGTKAMKKDILLHIFLLLQET